MANNLEFALAKRVQKIEEQSDAKFKSAIEITTNREDFL